MIEITEAAAVELKQLLAKENKMDHGVRIFAAGFGCGGAQYGLTLEKMQKDEDTVLNSNGIKIFFNKNLEDEIEDFKIDYINDESGSGFIIDNPNATGCGSGCSSCG